jgi:heptosyltransferase-2
MATPALVRIREAMPGAFIGALARPGIDRLLDGLSTADGRAVFDEVHVHHPTGVLGPKFAAAKVRPRRYSAALLLTNSFSTALVTRIAGVPRRIGYDRDGRGLLLTQKLRAPRHGGSWAIVPAVTYYWHAASALLDPRAAAELEAPALDDPLRVALSIPRHARMTLSVGNADTTDLATLAASAKFDLAEPFAILNPGGNNAAKRWPAARFAEIARMLTGELNLRVLINGSPAERALCQEIAAESHTSAVVLPAHPHTLGSLKALCAAAACRLMLTHDTGPRHIAAAMGCPLISLFGPTDPRWTTIPAERETILIADPTLPPSESANDHPERCAIERIAVERVVEAIRDTYSDAIAPSPRA